MQKTAKLIISIALSLLIAQIPAQSQEDTIQTLRETGQVFANIAKMTSPAVVGIEVEQKIEQSDRYHQSSPFDDPFFDDDLFERFFGRPRRRPRRSPDVPRYAQAQGSGFIIAADGYILTNNHVVGKADKITVKLQDGRQLEAKLIGTDQYSDVAVIKIDANDLPTLPLADSDQLKVGEWVLAIGNPFGLNHSVTAGIVSAKGRSGFGIAEYEDFIQTDAAINPGNSGGPLINLDGQVAGINTFIISPGRGGYMGIGFAIPINMAESVYNQLRDTGKVVRGLLGIYYQNLTPELTESFGLDKDTKGVLITNIVKDTAAEKAGLQKGDVIVELNGKPIKKANTFRNNISMMSPGTDAELIIVRDSKRKKITATIGESNEKLLTGNLKDTLDNLGFSVQDLTDELVEQFNYESKKGVIVTEVKPGSLAQKRGTKRGALIQEVNKKKITSVKEFHEALKKDKDATNLFFITDGRYSRYVPLPFED